MLNPEYSRARKDALRANAIENSSCIGNAACCEPTVPLTEGDIAIITKDILSGKISSDVINETISRNQDPSRHGRCPFLTPQNRCSIYESRPLACIVWGIGGDPIYPGDYNQAVREYKKGGPDKYPNLFLIQSTCLECRMMTAFNSTSIEANELARKACLAINPRKKKDADYQISEFIRTKLPKIKTRGILAI